MATYSIDESADDLTARLSAKDARSIVRSFEVVSSDPANTDATNVIDAMGFVGGVYITSPHPTRTWLTCEEIDPGTPDRDHPGLWRVRVTYSEPAPQPGTVTGTPTGPPPPPPPPPPGTPPAPQDRPAFVTLSYRKVEVFETEDLDGKRLQNAAGDLLESVPPRHRNIGVINYTRYYFTWNYGLGLALLGKVNLLAWNGFPPDTLQIDGVEAAPKTERGFTFWEAKYVILVDPLKWIPTKIENAGRRAFVRGKPRTPDNLLPVVGSTGTVLLNAQGFQWRPDLDAAPEPKPLEFRFSDRISFAGL